MGTQTLCIILLSGLYCISLVFLFGSFASTLNANEDESQSQRRLKSVATPKRVFVEPMTTVHQRPVQFIESHQLSDADMYSGAWWQSSLRFLTKHNVSNFFVEEGAFWSAYRRREHEVRMTVDYLDFSVEHMSKWWKIADFDRPGNQQAYHVVTNTFLSFVEKSAPSANVTKGPGTPMQDTLALVIFSPWKTKVSRVWTNTLSSCSLAATMASLIRLGCGRIVIATDVSFFRSTIDIMEGVSKLLKGEIKRDRLELESFFSDLKSPKRKWGFSVGNTEISFQPVRCSMAEGSILRNRPIIAKSALLSLRKAMLAQEEKRNPLASKWLGTNGRQWKFLYLTEADLILNTDTEAISAIAAELDQGKIAIPHRLQNLPHESDLPDYNWAHKVIPSAGAFSKVTSVKGRLHCCDNGADYPHQKHPCNHSTFWYSCGFPSAEHKNQERQELALRHARLAPYGLMRLEHGTGLASLVGNQNGRRCTLQEDPCRTY